MIMNTTPLLACLLTPSLATALPEGFVIKTYAEPFEVEYPTALTAADDGVAEGEEVVAQLG